MRSKFGGRVSYQKRLGGWLGWPGAHPIAGWEGRGADRIRQTGVWPPTRRPAQNAPGGGRAPVMSNPEEDTFRYIMTINPNFHDS